ncbi:MAG: hydantoinase/oxoprolinase family protein [Acetobacteraceae bacterium]
MARIGVDVGGTNTDLVLECANGVFYHKVPSTPRDQSVGVLAGIEGICDHAGISKSELETIVHGTTIATNITIEHNGAEVGMLTTRGFRDILHIGRHKRPFNFSLHFDVPWQSRPLVKRRNRIPVTERILPPQGEIVVPLAETEVLEAVRLFRKRHIEAVVVGFLFSFLNDTHEQRAKEIVLNEMPDTYVSLSSEVANVMREYERFSTTAMNAYVGPRTSFYLRNLERKLKSNGIGARLRVIQSNGGLATVDNCARNAVSILMSGPAGGVIGGLAEARLVEAENIITIDIGGTSADISTIPSGRLKIMNARDTYASGHPVLTPMIDMVTIGAGGGSIAHVDAAGGFQVGPRSAGSEPGPACYGKGGLEPTVTDAHVVLGRLDADQILGGDLKLDPDLARRAVAEEVARPLGLSLEEAALGIVRVVNSNMALAIRSNSVARGIDPRNFSLMPFGGAGPLHGVALAEAIGARDVIVPVAPGITAAMGLLGTDLQYEETHSVVVPLRDATELQLDRINRVVAELHERVRARFAGDAVAPDQQHFQTIAECRYHGQGFELRAPMPEGRLTQANKYVVVEGFHAQHRLDYGYCFEEGDVELMTLRVIGTAAAPKLRIPPIDSATGMELQHALLYTRPTMFDDGSRPATPRYDRLKLGAGNVIEGPALIIQHDSTTLLPPGYRALVLDHGHLRLCAIKA